MTSKIPPPLSARDTSSFAYLTFKDRLPVILVKVIDFLYKSRLNFSDYPDFIDQEYVMEAQNENKILLASVAKLRQGLETNKSVDLIQIITNSPIEDDVEAWNSAIKEHISADGSLPQWFHGPWLLMECLMYRKLKECFIKTKYIKNLDPFVDQKRAAASSCLAQMSSLADYMMSIQLEYDSLTSTSAIPNERKHAKTILQLSLWSNKADLSLSGMNHEAMVHDRNDLDIVASVDRLAANILCDNLSDVWERLQSIRDELTKSSPETKTYIDIVADNSGYELFVDLCLMHFITLMLSSKDKSLEDRVVIRLHVKQMPWFVSDANIHDVTWLLNYLAKDDNSENLKQLVNVWTKYFDDKRWMMMSHKFWTLPHDYSQMKSISEDLHSQLEQSSLIVFKGDLNYRKLTGDLKWNILTPFKTALRGFLPAPLVALRTCKADVVVGIENMEIYAKINNNQLPRDWMTSGDWGLIQYAKSI